MHYIAFLKYKAMGAQLLLIDFQMTCKCICFMHLILFIPYPKAKFF